MWQDSDPIAILIKYEQLKIPAVSWAQALYMAAAVEEEYEKHREGRNRDSLIKVSSKHSCYILAVLLRCTKNQTRVVRSNFFD